MHGEHKTGEVMPNDIVTIADMLNFEYLRLTFILETNQASTMMTVTDSNPTHLEILILLH